MKPRNAANQQKEPRTVDRGSIEYLLELTDGVNYPRTPDPCMAKRPRPVNAANPDTLTICQVLTAKEPRKS